MTDKTLLMLTELADWKFRENKIKGEVKLLGVVTAFQNIYNYMWIKIGEALVIPKERL